MPLEGGERGESLRAMVIVYVNVKQEPRSEDEDEDMGEAPTSSQAVPQQEEKTAEEAGPSLPSHSQQAAPTSAPMADSSSWPCCVCGQLLPSRQLLLAHIQLDHFHDIFHGHVLYSDENIRQKLIQIKSMEAILAHRHAHLALLTGQRPPPPLPPLPLPPPPPQLPPLPHGLFVPTARPIPQNLLPFPRQVLNLPMMANAPQQEKTEETADGRRGRPRHPVWRLFTRIDKYDAECTLCKSRVRTACPTNLCRHLNNNHCDIARELFAKWKTQKESAGGSYPPLNPPNTPRRTPKQISFNGPPLPLQKPALPPPPQPTKPPPPAPPIVTPEILRMLHRQQAAIQELARNGVPPHVIQAMNQQLLGHVQKALQSSSAAEVAVAADQEASSSAADRMETDEVEGDNEEMAVDSSVIRFSENAPSSSSPLAEDPSTSSARPQQSRSPSIDVVDEEEEEEDSSCLVLPPPRPVSASAECRGERGGSAERGSPRRANSLPMLSLDAMASHEYFVDASNIGGPLTASSVFMESPFGVQQSFPLQSLPTEQPALRQSTFQWFPTSSFPGVGGPTVDNGLAAGAYASVAPSEMLTGVVEGVQSTLAFHPPPTHESSSDGHSFFAAAPSSSGEVLIKQEVADVDEMAPSGSSAPDSSSTTGPAKRGRPTENPCWKYFTRIDDQLVRCNLCQKIVKSACSTNMTKHLERHHAEDHQQLLEQIKNYRRKQPLYLTPQLPSSSTALHHDQLTVEGMNALGHHHLMQPMAADGHHLLGHQFPLGGHHLPLSPDPSPSSAAHHGMLLQGGLGAGLRPEDLVLLQSDGLLAAPDHNNHYITSSDLYNTPFTNAGDVLMRFDDASQWQTQQWNPMGAMAGYEGWGNAAASLIHPDACTNTLVMDADAWQAAIASNHLLPHQNSVIQSSSIPTSVSDVSAMAALAAELAASESVSLDHAGVAMAVSESSASSASSTSSSTSSGSGVPPLPSAGSPPKSSLHRLPTSSSGEKPYMKRNRKTEHPVWEFFKRTVDGNAQCSICTGIVKSPCSSNFMRHLMRHHSVEYNSVYMKWVQKRGPLSKDTMMPPPPKFSPPAPSLQ